MCQFRDAIAVLTCIENVIFTPYFIFYAATAVKGSLDPCASQCASINLLLVRDMNNINPVRHCNTSHPLEDTNPTLRHIRCHINATQRIYDPRPPPWSQVRQPDL